MKNVKTWFLIVSSLFFTACAGSHDTWPLTQGRLTFEEPDLMPPEMEAEGPFEHPEFSVQGHRGAKANYPENTLPSILHALDVGAHQIEFDLHLSADDEIVVHHDPIINKKICRFHSGEKIKENFVIRNMTVKEIKQFDCGSVRNGKIPTYLAPGAKIPTFSEVVSLVLKHPRAHKVIFKIDVKSDPKKPHLYPSPSHIAKILNENLQIHSIRHRSIVSAFDKELLRELRSLSSETRLAVLTASFVNKKLLEFAIEVEAETISPHATLLSLQGMMKTTMKVQSLGFRMVPFTVNKTSTWKRLIEAGVDGIITDKPGDLLAYYEQHKDSGGKLKPTEQDLLDEEIRLTQRRLLKSIESSL